LRGHRDVKVLAALLVPPVLSSKTTSFEVWEVDVMLLMAENSWRFQLPNLSWQPLWSEKIN